MAVNKDSRKGARARSVRGSESHERSELYKKPVEQQDIQPLLTASNVEGLRQHFTDQIRRLHGVMSMVIVSIEALRRQDADNDDQIALVLQRGASDPLDVEIEKAEEIVAQLTDWLGKEGSAQQAA